MRRLTCRASLWAMSCALVVFLASGCGFDEEGYRVSGKVTFQNQPIPKGYITFSPDHSKNNDGPQGRATINNGAYKSDTGKGIVGGPYIVTVFGYDGVPAKSEDGEALPDGQPLFTPYRMTTTFPKEDTEKNIDVPAPK
jgi:hypothetical protein